MERLQRFLFLSTLFFVILAVSTQFVESQQQQHQQNNKQFSHRRIQSGPPKFNRRPPPGPPPHRQRRPNGPPPPVRGGGNERGPPPSRDQYNDNRGPPPPQRERDQYSGNGNKYNNNNYQRPQQQGPPPSSSYNNHNSQSQSQSNNPPPTPPPAPRQQYNNQRPGPPYQNSNQQKPLHPYTQQSPTAPAPSSLNPPMSTQNHPQQPMTNPPISEYAPPLNTFKSNSYKNSGENQQSSQQISLPGTNNTKHTITFTVTKKPSGATAINFQIQTPQNGQQQQQQFSHHGVLYGPSTYKPPLDPSYPNAGYTMKDRDEASSNDLLNPPPIFYNPQKDVMLNKNHPLNLRKNEIVRDPVKDYDAKFSQPDPLFHEDGSSSKDAEDSSVAGSSSQVLIAGQPLPKKNSKDEAENIGMDPNIAASQLLAALGLSKDPLISLQGQGEPLGLNDYLKSSPLFNKPDRIIDESSQGSHPFKSNKNKKDQDQAQSDTFPNLYGDDFESFSPGGSSFKQNEDQESKDESKLSFLLQRLKLQQQLLQLQQQAAGSLLGGSSNDVVGGLDSVGGSSNLINNYGPPPNNNNNNNVERVGPVSYIEQRLKGVTAPLNLYGTPPSPPSNNNFGLSNDNRQTSSYLEQKLRQGSADNDQSYIQQLLNRNNQQNHRHHSSDLSGAYAHHSQNNAQSIRPNLDLTSQFSQSQLQLPPQQQQHGFGPSTQNPSSLEMEEYNTNSDKQENSQGLYGQQNHQIQNQIPGGGIGSLPGNVLLPGGFGGTHLQQNQQQQQQQHNLNQSPVFNRQQHQPFQQQQHHQQPNSAQLGSGSAEHSSGQTHSSSYIPHHNYQPQTQQNQQNYPQESQQNFQQRQQFEQNQNPQNAQYAAVNPLQPTPQQFPQQPQQQQSQASIQNYNYQQPPPHQQQLVPNPSHQQIAQQSHPQSHDLPPPQYGGQGNNHNGFSGPGVGQSYGPPDRGGVHGPPGFGFGGQNSFGSGSSGNFNNGGGGGNFGNGNFNGQSHGPSPTPPPQQQIFVVTEAEPIIEIIVQDSNVTLPPQHFPTQPPPPPPTPEPVHVFYVKYSENKFPGQNPHDPEINLESPIPSINVRGPGPGGYGGPERHLQVEPSYDNLGQLSEQHPQNNSQIHPHPSSVEESSAPASSTTLRTIINPSKNSFSDTKLAVHFDQPPESYPFDMSQYQKTLEHSQQKQQEQQPPQNHEQSEQQQMHQQMYQHFQQNKDQIFLNKRIGVEEFSSLLQEGSSGAEQQPQQQQNNNNNQQNPNYHEPTPPPTLDKSKELPPDVPHHLRQQLINSGILNNAEVQVVNFDENLFKELSSLPPEAISALQQQQAEFSHHHHHHQNHAQSTQNYQQEDFSNLQKRHVNKIFIERLPNGNLRKRPRSILFKTKDNHLYRLRLKKRSNFFSNGSKLERIC